VSPVTAMRARSAAAETRPSRGTSILAPVLGLVLAGAGVPWIYYLAKNLSANLGGLIYASGRTAITAAALMVGISLVVAFSALGGSLLGSIKAYLDGSLGSDYVVQPSQQNSDAGFSAKVPEKIGRVQGVEKTTSIASTFRRDGKRVDVVFGVDQNYPEIFRVNYAAGGPDAFSELKKGGALVGSQLAKDRKLSVGSRIGL